MEEGIPAPFDAWPRKIIDTTDRDARLSPSAIPVNNLSESWGDKVSSYRNLMDFLHALDITYFSQILPHAPDYVIFVRPDLRIEGRLWLRTRLMVLVLLGALGPQAMLPSWARHRGANDRFVILSAKAASNYFTRISKAHDFFATGTDLNSEKFLAWSLSNINVSHSIYTPMRRIRLGGVPDPSDDALVKRSATSRRLDISRARALKKIRRIRLTLKGWASSGR